MPINTTISQPLFTIINLDPPHIHVTVNRMLRPLLGLIFSILIASITGCKPQQAETYPATQKPTQSSTLYPFTHFPERQQETGPESCVSCHAEEVESWKRSHHAKANRLISPELDAAAFNPTRTVIESGVTYRLKQEGEQFLIEVQEADGSSKKYPLIGVIGVTPVRQYLAVFPGNKLQTISATYDVTQDKWFDVFQNQDRLPGEWGHWAGQGMNWNANCADCHMTGYNKNLDPDTGTYHSKWTQQGIACAECHTGLERHVQAAQKDNYVSTIPAMTKQQTMDNCASCHSRRAQLTEEAFKPGDNYHDHFALSLPDQPGLYHPDGQIFEEVFVHASFQMSRMGHAGVSCMDCHDPHSLEHTLPVENNMLCMKCHDSGLMKAPIIQPTTHSFHPAGSTGNRCVECHMPKTTYMQADPRADHGFLLPDPLMTKELGIPNACSSCHTDQSLDWAIEHAENWYGEKLAQKPQRKRARAIAAAYQYQPQALDQLIELSTNEDIPAWIAAYAGLIGNYLPNPKAEAHLKSLIDHPEPLVRSAVLRGLVRTESAPQITIEKLSDSSRSVRLDAARYFEITGQQNPDATVLSEWQRYLSFNSDRPQDLLLVANRAGIDGDFERLELKLKQATQLDSLNGEIYRQAAILASTYRLNNLAQNYLKQGWNIDRSNALFPYSLGLLAAEQNDLQQAINYLEESVAMQPDFARAWYNLSLAYQQANRPQEAQRAMLKAQSLQ